MSSLQPIVDAVAHVQGAKASVLELIRQLREQLANAGTPEEVSAIAAELEAVANDLANAVVANP